MSGTELKRYLLFMGYIYDSAGGWADFIDSFDSAADAEGYGKKHKYSKGWYQVIDKVTGEQMVHYIDKVP